MRLGDLYKTYKNQVEFIVVYIREAHPIEGWWLGEGLIWETLTKDFAPRVSTSIYEPTTLEERQAVASACRNALQYGIRTFVDSMDDTVSKAYAAKPTRLYFIGRDGRVEYEGPLGPWGFSPEELKNAIDQYLKTNIS